MLSQICHSEGNYNIERIFARFSPFYVNSKLECWTTILWCNYLKFLPLNVDSYMFAVGHHNVNALLISIQTDFRIFPKFSSNFQYFFHSCTDQSVEITWYSRTHWCDRRTSHSIISRNRSLCVYFAYIAAFQKSSFFSRNLHKWFSRL